MTGVTITRIDFFQAMHEALGITRSDSKKIIEMIFRKFIEDLDKHKKLKITNFGSFRVVHKSQRMGRNPKTLEPRVISARNVALFRKSKAFLNALHNHGV